MDTKQKRQTAKLVEVFFLGLAFLQMTTDNWVSKWDLPETTDLLSLKFHAA